MVRKDFSFSKSFIQKFVIMHGKGEFAKIKGSICNVPIETSNICKMLPSNICKMLLNYRGHVIFEPVKPIFVYEPIRFLEDHNKLYSHVLVNEDLLSDEMMNF